MDTKETINDAIETIKYYNRMYYDAGHTEDLDKVIELLQRGKKLEKIVWEIKNEIIFDEYDGVYDIPSNSPKNIHKKIKKIIEKYFPKEVNHGH